MVRVLCAGHVNWDVTLRVDALPGPDGEAAITTQSQAGGGSASNTAAGLAALGVDTALVGSVGDDEYGPLVREELSALGVDCSPVLTVSAGETTVKYLVVDEDGQVMVLANDGVNESFRSADVSDELFAAADHLHLTGQSPETALRLAKRGVESGLTVSVDPGPRVCERDYSGAVAHAEYLFVNGRELDCARERGLVGRATATVCKRGNDGARLLGDGERDHRGYDVDVLDTTGAGDAFAAGFLAATLTGRSRADALAVGNACGALASRVVGARAPLSWDAVDAVLTDS